MLRRGAASRRPRRRLRRLRSVAYAWQHVRRHISIAVAKANAECLCKVLDNSGDRIDPQRIYSELKKHFEGSRALPLHRLATCLPPSRRLTGLPAFRASYFPSPAAGPSCAKEKPIRSTGLSTREHSDAIRSKCKSNKKKQQDSLDTLLPKDAFTAEMWSQEICQGINNRDQQCIHFLPFSSAMYMCYT